MRSPPITEAQASRRPRLRVSDAARYCGISISLLNKLRMTGGGPRFIKISNIVCYDPADLDAWLDTHRRLSTSEDAA